MAAGKSMFGAIALALLGACSSPDKKQAQPPDASAPPSTETRGKARTLATDAASGGDADMDEIRRVMDDASQAWPVDKCPCAEEPGFRVDDCRPSDPPAALLERGVDEARFELRFDCTRTPVQRASARDAASGAVTETVTPTGPAVTTTGLVSDLRLVRRDGRWEVAWER